MKICDGWLNFKNEIVNGNKSIVCFGAGMMALYIEKLFVKEGLWERIYCFLDNDTNKSGRVIGDTKPKEVKTVEIFLEEEKTDYVILITCVTFIPIIEQLQKIDRWKDIHCYIYPKVNKDIVHLAEYKPLDCSRNENIPKIIHYCWFGKSELGKLETKCIESWKKYCPDYEIIEWSEENYDISKNLYMKEAYENKKWAYVSDYARLDILYKYGGVYFDTDVELIKNIDVLLGNKAFIAYGEWPVVNSGAGIGSVKENALIKEMRDHPRKEKKFVDENGNCDMTQNCVYETKVLEKYGFLHNFEMQYVNDMLILPPKFIATSSVIGCDAYITEETFAIHHNGESWSDEKRKREKRLTQRRTREE